MAGAVGKVRYMGKALCPIYRYWHGSAYMRALASIAGAVAGACIALLLLLPVPAWSIPLLAPVPAALAGFMVDRLLFFSSHRDRALDACTGGATGTVVSLGIVLVTLGHQWVYAGIATMVVPVAITWILLKRGGPIALYTDGFTVGKRVFMYDDVIVANWGCGREVGENVPEEGQEKSIVYLTPLDYEHVEEDFGITHHYAYVVTGDAVHVIQPLRSRSEFAANVRNAWACWDYDKRTSASRV